MLKNEYSVVWGRAFLVQLNSDRSRPGNCPLAYLDTRESKEGGYVTLTTAFYPRALHQAPFTARVYVALPSNPLYLGPKSYPEMAREIVQSQGECGPNVEYVLNIADFMREEVFGIDDEHLFMLEMHILIELANRAEEEQSFQAQLERKHSWCSKLAICNSLQGSRESLSEIASASGASSSKYGAIKGSSHGETSEDFVSNVAARKLRCVDI
ncbi:glutathione-specific gamma-glutamylcyclotransferase 1-like [Varroa jacobsoni]|nr:glutathione-specific gamma-glutamylcyclotransferase 1-like [Varroa jacobsoni]